MVCIIVCEIEEERLLGGTLVNQKIYCLVGEELGNPRHVIGCAHQLIVAV